MRRHTALLWIIAVIVIAALEVGVFNLAHWRTTHTPAITSGTAVIGKGLAPTDGTAATSATGTFTISDPDTATIDIPIANATDGGAAELQSIRLAPTSDSWQSATAEFYTTSDTADSDTSDSNTANSTSSSQSDSTNSDTTDSTSDTSKTDTSNSTTTKSTTTDSFSWRNLGAGVWTDNERTLTYTKLPSTQYILAGQKSDNNRTSTWLRISFSKESAGTTVSLSAIELNPTVPMFFSLPRVLIMLAVATFLICFRPGSVLWRRELDITSRGHKVSLAVFIVVQSAVLLVVSQLTGGAFVGHGINFGWGFQHWFDPLQYQRLGDALLHGHTWLDLQVDNSLQAMSNPYDFEQRQALNRSTGAVYYWDHAYFQGKYYCYFGVLPAVFLFAPFQLVTGHWLPTWAASWLLAVGFTIFGALLASKFVARYFPHASQAMAWMALLTLMVANSMWYYVFAPSFYGIPMLMSMTLTAAALYFWVSARRDAATGKWAGGAKFAARGSAADTATATAASPATKLSAWRVVLGSVLMTMNVGSRPQFAIAFLLAFPIFWHEIRHTRQLFSRSSWRLTLAAELGALLVLVPLLGYNAVRFGSLLDFGSDYNLTAYDMTNQRPSRYLMPAALFVQLFQPAAISPRFPFVQTTDNALPLPCEPSLGGIFAIVPFTVLALGFWMMRRQLKAHRVWGFTVLCLALAALALVFDTSIGGVNNRYYGDYAHLIALAAICVALCLEEQLRGARAGVGREAGHVTARKTNDAANNDTGGADFRGNLRDDVTATCVTPASRIYAVVIAAMVLFALYMVFAGFFATGRYEALTYRNPVLFAYVQSWFAGLCM
ncbi:MAG: hypothetical protein PUF51_02885 [Bifidobacteriaceae bacterium]|nr:hypothetical protein [Bifidobacteriaceae bacterium]